MLKRNPCAGETLAEMMVSMLIISMGMLMLSQAIVVAARVNWRTEQMLNPETEYFSDDSDSYSGSYVQFAIPGKDDGFTVRINVTQQNGDFFYEYEKKTD